MSDESATTPTPTEASATSGVVSEDQVKLYVGYLRKKLGTNAGTESPIETVRGFGYRYRPARV